MDKTQKLPPRTSPMGIMFLMVQAMRQNLEFQKSRVMAQAMLAQKGADEKSISEAFDMLKEAFFPFDKNQKKAQLKDMRTQMLREISRGPLGITPMADPNRKKVASRLVQGQGEQTRREQMTKAGALSSMDAFDQARKRRRNERA